MPLFLWFEILWAEILTIYPLQFWNLRHHKDQIILATGCYIWKNPKPPKICQKITPYCSSDDPVLSFFTLQKKSIEFREKKIGNSGIRESWKHLMSLTLFANFSLQSLVSFVNPIWVCPDVLLMHSAPSWIPVLVTENH